MAPPNAFQRALLQAKHSEEDADAEYEPERARDGLSPFYDAPSPSLGVPFSPQRSNTGLPSPNWKPPTDTDFRGPAMSYHLLSGGHGLSAQGWDLYLNGDLFAR